MKHVLLVVLILIGASCSESKMMLHRLTTDKRPLGYELISPIDSSAKVDSVIVTFTGFPLDSLTTVHRKKCLILPFLFINIVEFKYRFKLGNNLLQEDYNPFFFNALLDESQRSGNFSICDDSTRSKDVYNLDVTLDTCMTDTYYLINSLSVYYVKGYWSTYSESSFPVRSKLGCTIRLRKGDQVLKDTTISVTHSMEFVNGDNITRDERLLRTADCMVATLCQSTRDCISEMILNVNAVIAAQKR